MSPKKFQTIINQLINVAHSGTNNFKLAATLMRDSKPIGKPTCNSERNYCRGKYCPSLHAEAGSMLQHFGRNLRWSLSAGWTLYCEKGENSKVRYFCN
jgi:hypothetical protein